MTTPRPRWTVDEVRALGVWTTVPIAGAIFGFGRTRSYELVDEKNFVAPFPVIRVGRRLLVPVHAILRRLEVDENQTT